MCWIGSVVLLYAGLCLDISDWTGGGLSNCRVDTVDVIVKSRELLI